MIIDEFLDQYTTVELEKSIREGLDPMGGPNSPMRVPNQSVQTAEAPSINKNRNAGHSRSPSPKKLL